MDVIEIGNHVHRRSNDGKVAMVRPTSPTSLTLCHVLSSELLFELSASPALRISHTCSVVAAHFWSSQRPYRSVTESAAAALSRTQPRLGLRGRPSSSCRFSKLDPKRLGQNLPGLFVRPIVDFHSCRSASSTERRPGSRPPENLDSLLLCSRLP